MVKIQLQVTSAFFRHRFEPMAVAMAMETPLPMEMEMDMGPVLPRRVQMGNSFPMSPYPPI